MVLIKDIVKPRKEVIEGRFQGVVQSHKIDAKEPRIENDPDETNPGTSKKSAVLYPTP